MNLSNFLIFCLPWTESHVLLLVSFFTPNQQSDTSQQTARGLGNRGSSWGTAGTSAPCCCHSSTAPSQRHQGATETSYVASKISSQVRQIKDRQGTAEYSAIMKPNENTFMSKLVCFLNYGVKVT